MTRLPDFVVSGAAKSGTTSLYHYLQQHPKVWLPAEKEPFFFGKWAPRKGTVVRSFDEYAAIYAPCPGGSVTGDFSTSYLYTADPGEIVRVLGQVPAFAILRNPIDRAYSLYWHHRRAFQEPRTFREALSMEEQRIGAGWPFGFHYVRSGMYSHQVAKFREAFGDSFHVYQFDEFKTDPGYVLKRMLGVLGLDNISIDTSTAHNRSGPPRSRLLGRLLTSDFPGRDRLKALVPEGGRRAKRRLMQRNQGPQPPMTEEDRQYLVDQFRADIHELESQLGWDLEHWLTPKRTS